MPRVAFLGTPEPALPLLEAAGRIGELVLVVTRPDRPRGRSGRPQPSPVKRAALEARVPIAQPASAAELTAVLQAAKPLDLAVVAAFGMLIRPEALAVPGAGFVNTHFSVLPRWRGAAPVQHALLASDERTGTTLFRLDAGLDTGPVLAVRSTGIGAEETAGELTRRLALLGADLLVEVVPRYLAGEVTAVPQPVWGATSAPKIGPELGRLRFYEAPTDLARRVRALSPRPGAYALWRGDRLRVLRARPAEGRAGPGELEMDKDRLLVGAGRGRVELVEVQPAGGRPMHGAEWGRGRRRELGRLE